MSFLLTVALLWIVCCNADTKVEKEYENVALRGRATQSSIYHDKDWGYLGMALNAIDGNLNNDAGLGSCSHTHNDFAPWWRVDLLRPHKIQHVTITNRFLFGQRLIGAEIRIGNSLENNGNNNPRCAQITSILDGATRTFECNNMVGRYVNIFLPEKQEFLQLCEVQVFGEPEVGALSTGYKNVALRGRATQSSVYQDKDWGYLGMALNAIDGNLNKDAGLGSCSHTHNDYAPWWRVDLLRPHKINQITITNRILFGQRLIGAEIRIGNSLENNGNNNPRCAQITSIPDGATRTFQCNNMVGRYVNIIIPEKREFLQLCEVQVFGVSEEDDQLFI